MVLSQHRSFLRSLYRKQGAKETTNTPDSSEAQAVAQRQQSSHVAQPPSAVFDRRSKALTEHPSAFGGTQTRAAVPHRITAPATSPHIFALRRFGQKPTLARLSFRYLDFVIRI